MGMTLKEAVEAQEREELIRQSEIKQGEINKVKVKVPVKTAGEKIREIMEEEPEKKKTKIVRDEKDEKEFSRAAQISGWFQTICFMNIPIIGVIYLIVMADRKKTPPDKKNFAIAYIIYKVLVWLLALTLIYCLYKVGLNLIDGILKYASGN